MAGGEMGPYGGPGRQGMSPERRRQATLPVRRHRAAERDRERDGPFPLERGPHAHGHSHRRSHKQRSQSLPRNRDPVPGKMMHTSAHMEERSEDEEAEGQTADILEGEEGKDTTAGDEQRGTHAFRTHGADESQIYGALRYDYFN